MERMWRKVNHSFTGRTSKSTTTIQSTDTVSSAGGFGDGQIVVAVAGIQATAAASGSNTLTAAAAGATTTTTTTATTANNITAATAAAAAATSSSNNNMPSSTATGRRLAASGGAGGQLPVPIVSSCGVGVTTTTIDKSSAAAATTSRCPKSLSQHVLLNSTASSERRRRRRRKSRARRSIGVSCVGGGGGGGGDNMSSSGGFYTIKESSGGGGSNHRHHRQSHSSSNRIMLANSAPSGTVMMYPNSNKNRHVSATSTGMSATMTPAATTATASAAATITSATTDISLRQRAVAKLRMFNFHLNWDLHMTHCKPCGPRIGGGGGGGNIITRRLCRNRRREDNELYRSNSFKFERFERKECIDDLTDTLQKRIAICDDYSLPVDFVKKRPSSFDPCLADSIPTNPENWAVSSPQTEFISFAEAQQQQQKSQQQQQQQQQHTSQHHHQQGPPPPPPPAPPALSTLPTASATLNNLPTAKATNTGNSSNAPPPLPPTNTLPILQQQQQQALQSYHQYSIQLKSHNQRNQQQQQQQQQQLLQRLPHPPLPNTIKHASVKLIEGYSDPKDSKRHKKVYHKKGKRRVAAHKNQKQQKSQSQSQQQLQSQLQAHPEPPQQQNKQKQELKQQQQPHNKRDKRSNYSSDSSAPKSSDDDDDDNQSIKVPELNSPDSISDDLVRPLPPQLYRSPRKLAVAPSETSKRNPSPYYYSDLLKPKDPTASAADKETKNKCRQSTASEPPLLTQPPVNDTPYRKSTSLDVPERSEEREEEVEEEDDFEETEPTSTTVLAVNNETPKRYSFTEEGVHIIRCDSPSTSTSEESDCSECQKRREWHARALALVRKTCNILPLNPAVTDCNHDDTENLTLVPFAEESPSSMPPHRLLGPAVCACVAPTIGDDLEEYFRPRSIFYVHPHGVHECADCLPDSKKLSSNASTSRSALDTSSLAQSDNVLEEDDDVDGAADNDEMSGRTRQIYETAFDCKIAKSDDDLDEVDRITNHAVLLQLNNGNNLPSKVETPATRKSGSHGKSRLEGKRLKNSKNHAIQEQASNSGGNASGSGSSPHTVGGGGGSGSGEVAGSTRTADPVATSVSALTTDIGNVHIRSQNVDQQNNTTTSTASTSQLPMRGYTPSPPSTAPLPMKFPGKHERFFMNSIKSAPNLPSSNPAHPRLRDLRLPIQSSFRQLQHQQQQLLQQQQGSSLGTSNENSLTDSAFVNPPSHALHPPSSTLSVSSSRTRHGEHQRPRSFVLESGRVLELRKSHHASHHHHVGNGGRRQQHHNYSSTESIATSSSGGSMESLRSSTSESNRSTSSSESRHSTSLSSHSSESGSSSVAFPLRAPVVIHSKLHILSPISDKSSQEPASEISEQNKTQNASPEEAAAATTTQQQQNGHTLVAPAHAEHIRPVPLQVETLKNSRRRAPPNKTLLHLADEIIGSDSGISLHSREDGKLVSGSQKFTLPKLNFPPSDKANDSSMSAVAGMSNSVGLPQDLRDLPFDMPKLRRRKTLQQDACTSGSATSVDLGDLPFDMPKLRRRLRANQSEINNLLVHSTESSGISQASSSHSMRDDSKAAIKLDTAIFRQNLTLNLNEPRQASSSSKFGSLDLRGLPSNKELNLNLTQGFTSAVDLIDVSIPLERQGWYHGAITRIEAETTLRPLTEGSFLVRNCESTKQDYSLSLKGAKGFMHMRIQRNEAGQYILGQFSRPFETVPDMIRHFCLNRLPVRGAEHMCLLEPVIAQIL